jgi:hypothetical protein
VRGVGGDVGKEGLAGAALGVHPFGGLTVEHVGAIAAGLDELPVVQDRGIKILVAGRVAARAGKDLPDAAPAVDEHFVKAARGGQILFFIAEMPLAEDAGGVTRIAEHLSESDGLWCEAFAFEDGVGDAVLELVAAGEEGGAGRGTGGADVKILKAHALGAEAVEVGRLEDGVAVGGDVAVALVVGEEEDDVGLSGGLG